MPALIASHAFMAGNEVIWKRVDHKTLVGKAKGMCLNMMILYDLCLNRSFILF